MTHRTKCSSGQELPTERGDTTFWEKENIAMALQGAPAHAHCQQHKHPQKLCFTFEGKKAEHKQKKWKGGRRRCQVYVVEGVAKARSERNKINKQC